MEFFVSISSKWRILARKVRISIGDRTLGKPSHRRYWSQRPWFVRSSSSSLNWRSDSIKRIAIITNSICIVQHFTSECSTGGGNIVHSSGVVLLALHHFGFTYQNRCFRSCTTFFSHLNLFVQISGISILLNIFVFFYFFCLCIVVLFCGWVHVYIWKLKQGLCRQQTYFDSLKIYELYVIYINFYSRLYGIDVQSILKFYEKLRRRISLSILVT